MTLITDDSESGYSVETTRPNWVNLATRYFADINNLVVITVHPWVRISSPFLCTIRFYQSLPFVVVIGNANLHVMGWVDNHFHRVSVYNKICIGNLGLRENSHCDQVLRAEAGDT